MQGIYALLLYVQDEPLGTLKVMLEGQEVRAYRGRSCREAFAWLKSWKPPELIFTAITLPDGTWEDVLSLAAKMSRTTSVIVVDRWFDIQLYAEAVQRGAFDFIVPPFDRSNLVHIVRCASGNTSGGRNALTNAA